MRIDIHTSIGLFPDTKNIRSKSVHASVNDMVKFITKHQITHHVCIYPTDQYYLLDELSVKLPDIVHMGVQMIGGRDYEHPTDIDHIKLDILDSTKPLCKGIKLASHRGWFYRHPEVSSRLLEELPKELQAQIKHLPKIVQAGLHYDVHSGTIKKLLDQLPSGAIVSVHTQGDEVVSCGARPLSIAKWAYAYPHLKFIINHMGDYCQSKFSIVPTPDSVPYTHFRFGQSKASIWSAVSFAENLKNIWLDTSKWSPAKAMILNQSGCSSWCTGSDYPFPASYTSEYNKIVTDMGQDKVDKQMELTLKWLTK